MNLAFITKRYDIMGGTERDLYELTSRLAVSGHEIHVYCLDAKVDAPTGVRIHLVRRRFATRTGKLWNLASRGCAMAYEGRHDLVVSYARVLKQDVIRCGGGTHKAFLKEIAASESTLKQLVRRFDPYHRSMINIERRQFSSGNYKKIIAISKMVKAEVMKTYGVPESAIATVYDGIDLERFSTARRKEHRAAIRKKHALSEDTTVMLFVGNAFKRKGLDTALAAMKRLENEDVYFMVVGSDPQMNHYKNIASTHGLDRKVLFVGSRAEPAPYYAAADVFVMPSLHEAFGNVALEAMACGCPTIVSACSGASEVLTGALEAYILKDPRDDEGLAALVRKALDANEEGQLSRQVRAIAEHYSLERHAEESLRVFRKTQE